MSTKHGRGCWLSFIAILFVQAIQEHRSSHVDAKGSLSQCGSYFNLSDSFRNSRRAIVRLPTCDSNLRSLAWYRFIGAAGNMMRSSHIGSGKCGTSTPGWVQGAHPRYINTTTSVKVCFDVHKNISCGESKTILITNCYRNNRGYYVYQLPRIASAECYKGYCGEDGSYSGMVLATTVSSTKMGPTRRANATGASTSIGSKPGLVAATDTHRENASEVNVPTSVQSKIDHLYKQVSYLKNSNVSRTTLSKAANDIIKILSNLTDLERINGSNRLKMLNEDELVYTVKILRDVIGLNISNGSLDLLQPASNILDRRNTKSWHQLKNSTEVLSNLVVCLEDYGFQLSRNTKHEYGSLVIQNTTNLALRVRVAKPRRNSTSQYTSFHFPNTSFDLSPSAFGASDNSTNIVVVVYYKTLHSLLKHVKLRDDGFSFDSLVINSEIVTASVRPEPLREFEKPVRIKWKKNALHSDTTVCVFWKPEESRSTWSKEGCRKIQYSVENDQFVCECNHLTAFASMDISDGMVTDRERQSLELISTIGCSLSLLGVLLTVVSHAIMWNKLHTTTKTEVRTRVLMNLCIAIGMTDILAIISGPVQHSEMFCKVVSMLLYFFVLSVFGWMLCEGITIYLQLVRVFTVLGGRHLRVFYAVGWGIPITVLALSVGLVDRNEFITEHACWFRANGALLWIFVCVAGVTLLINLAVLLLVLKNMLSSQNLSRAGLLNRAKAGMKATAVLLPLLGLTWLFGLLVFNRDTIVFKYLFAIFNSLQGLMIFFFHVVINKQIQDIIRRERNMRKTLYKTPVTILNNKQKCGTLSTSDTKDVQKNFRKDVILPKHLGISLNDLQSTEYPAPRAINNNNTLSDDSRSNKTTITDLKLEDLE